MMVSPTRPAVPKLTEAELKSAEEAAESAVTLLTQGKNDEAEQQLKRALAARPDDARASENLTRLRLRPAASRKPSRTSACAIAQFPASLPLRVQYVRVLIRAEPSRLALVEAKKVLKTDERNVPRSWRWPTSGTASTSWNWRATYYENAAAIEPQNAEAANAQGFVHLAMEAKPLGHRGLQARLQAGARRSQRRTTTSARCSTRPPISRGPTNELMRGVEDRARPRRHLLNLGNAHRGAKRYEEAEGAYPPRARAGAAEPSRSQTSASSISTAR